MGAKRNGSVWPKAEGPLWWEWPPKAAIRSAVGKLDEESKPRPLEGRSGCSHESWTQLWGCASQNERCSSRLFRFEQGRPRTDHGRHAPQHALEIGEGLSQRNAAAIDPVFADGVLVRAHPLLDH